MKAAVKRCKRGHLFNEKNTLRRMKKGKVWRTCRKCVSMIKTLKYATDAEFRERKKTRERNRYYENKESRA